MGEEEAREDPRCRGRGLGFPPLLAPGGRGTVRAEAEEPDQVCVLENSVCWEEKTPQPAPRRPGGRRGWTRDTERLQAAGDFGRGGGKGGSTAAGHVTRVPRKSAVMRKGPHLCVRVSV